MADKKPKILVVGGLGFIGRSFVEYVGKNDLASRIVVVDKSVMALNPLSDAQKEIMQNKDLVLFKQMSVSQASQANNALALDDGGFDYVFNLVAETKYSQSEEIYRDNITKPADTLTAAAKAAGVKKFIHFSTAQVYEAGKKPSTESDSLKPWTKLAKAHIDAENKVSNSGLDYTIFRPAIVYGPGDVTGITPRLICATVYQFINSEMEFLWDKDLRINTVHINDVVRAMWHCATKVDGKNIFNLCDENDTTQGSLNKLIEPIFKIKTGFVGNMKSKVFTGVAMKTVAEKANEKHLKPWSDLLQKKEIANTPLTPYLDEELLYNNPLSINGTKITSSGFKYEHPKMTEQDLKDSLQHYINLGSYPKGIF